MKITPTFLPLGRSHHKKIICSWIGVYRKIWDLDHRFLYILAYSKLIATQKTRHVNLVAHVKSVPYSDPKKIPCFPLLSSFWPRIECPERWPWALREDPASSWLGKTPFGLAKIRDDEWQNQRQTNKNIDIGWKIYWIPKNNQCSAVFANFGPAKIRR